MTSQDFFSEPTFVDVNALDPTQPTIQVKNEPIDTDDLMM